MEAPSYLGKEAQRVFLAVADYLKEHDKFHDIDTLLIEQFAVAYESYRRNYDLICKEGEVLRSDKGNAYMHPAKSAMAQTVNVMQALAKSLGIGEYNRKLAGFLKKESKDEFLEFLKGDKKADDKKRAGTKA